MILWWLYFYRLILKRWNNLFLLTNTCSLPYSIILYNVFSSVHLLVHLFVHDHSHPLSLLCSRVSFLVKEDHPHLPHSLRCLFSFSFLWCSHGLPSSSAVGVSLPMYFCAVYTVVFLLYILGWHILAWPFSAIPPFLCYSIWVSINSSCTRRCIPISLQRLKNPFGFKLFFLLCFRSCFPLFLLLLLLFSYCPWETH